MVRLVFRPYTQVKRSICTSEPLRTSTRVSSGFILLKHSSPSFGSQPACSYSNLQHCACAHCYVRSVGAAVLRRTWHQKCSLSLRVRVLHTQTLARQLDSLVRVSRRVVERHFVSIRGDPLVAWHVARYACSYEWSTRLSHRATLASLVPYPAPKGAGLKINSSVEGA